MTTQELKQYIDKVLGNNLRCLLPSYWWKRLFTSLADRVDEVEQSTSKLIESKVEEVKMPIVESVDELEKLELAKGRVAAVEKTGESATVKISDCYLSTNSKEDWSKYTIVKGVEEKDNVIIDKDTTVVFTASKGMVTKDALQVSTIRSDTFYYMKWTDDVVRVSSLEEVNKALSSGKYRAVQCSNDPDDYFTFYSEIPQPSLYIKGDSWERLAKESDLEGVGASITVDTELSATSENPVQNKVIYENLYGMNEAYTQMYEELGASVHEVTADIYTKLLKKVDYVAGKQLSTEDFTTALKTKLEGLSNYDDTAIQNAVNSLTTQINTLVSGDASAAIESFNEIIAFLNGVEDSESLDSIIASIEQQIAGKQDKLVSGTNIKTINEESILGEGNIVVNVDTSNLATKEELNAKQDVIEDLDTIRSGAAKGATALQEHQDISHLASKEELQNLQNEVIANEEVVAAAFNDVNDRINAISENVSGTTVTKEELESTVEIINQTISDNKSATDVAIEGLETSIGNVDAKFANYATTEALTTEITNLTNEIIANEEVHAAALNDLNERLNNGGGGSGGSGVGAIKVYALPETCLNDLFGSLEITQESWAVVKSEIEADIPNSVFVTLMDSAFATNATAYQTLMNIAEQGESTFVLLDLGKLNIAFQYIDSDSDEDFVPYSAVFISSVFAVKGNNPFIQLIPYGIISAQFPSFTSHYFPSLELYPDGGYGWYFPLEQQ